MQDSTVNPDLAMVRIYESNRQRDYEFLQFVTGMLAEAAKPIWEQGDGYGGTVHELVETAFRDAGLRYPEDSVSEVANRRKISGSVRTQVYERDHYRCVSCGGHLDLSLDHIVPWSKGGSDDPENLQTLCRPCNSRKGVN